MKDDDPVEELHKIREAIWKEAGGTPAAYAQYYYEMSQKRLAEGKTTQKITAKPPAQREKQPQERRAVRRREQTTKA